MTIRSAQEQLVASLQKLYETREATQIARMVMEKITGLDNSGRLIAKDQVLSEQQQADWTKFGTELSAHRPVQYVLGEAWFAGIKFYVNEYTLIPRPETEELIEWIAEEIQSSPVKPPTIIDIGTGSGCIPVVLKKKYPGTTITAIDISEEALQVATRNANSFSAEVNYMQINFLDENATKDLGIYDIIVSNPPYIESSGRSAMDKHVTAYEPGIALFVPDDDPLLFYRKIAAFGQQHLRRTGHIFLEINEALGKQTAQLFEAAGYTTILKQDLQGKDRMIKASPNPTNY